MAAPAAGSAIEGYASSGASQDPTASSIAFAPPTPQNTVSAGRSNQSYADAASDDFRGLGPLWMLPATEREQLISTFYNRFYVAHPVLVPRTFFDTQRYPRYLQLVVCYIGHHYGPLTDNATALHDAVHLAMAEEDEQTVSRVQALSMYAILLHARNDAQAAEDCVARAARIALQLGVNDPAFAETNGHGHQVVEESLRRTWWELYITDVYVAALHRRTVFRTEEAAVMPLLPCSQLDYELERCDTTPSTLRLFEDRVFAMNEPTGFSSFCYRIEAARLVERSLAFGILAGAAEDGIDALDKALASWQYTLPRSHRELIDKSGNVDQMLLQAHCFVNCTSIFLHFPRSDLPMTVPSTADVACAQGLTKTTSTSTLHSVKAIAASKALSFLTALSCSLDRHSPLFACGLILGCVVQLAAASSHYHVCATPCSQPHRDMVVLMLGALRRMGEIWHVARNAVHHLGLIAEAVFTGPAHNETESTFAGDTTTTFDNLGSIADFAGVPWLDLFALDGLQNETMIT